MVFSAWFLVASLFLGCEKKTHRSFSESETVVFRQTEIGQDFFVPSRIWDQISGQGLSQVQEKGTMTFLPVRVVFEEKNPGVLKHPRMIFEFPKGGGEVDLQQVIGNRVGTFYVRFELEAWADPDKLQIYFINKAKKTKVQGLIRGDSCDRAYAIKSFMLSHRDRGLEVNTYLDQHVQLLGGHFVFSTRINQQSMVTQVGFFDSQRAFAFCENLLQKRRKREVAPKDV
jgi:hypothetical protein